MTTRELLTDIVATIRQQASEAARAPVLNTSLAHARDAVVAIHETLADELAMNYADEVDDDDLERN